MSEQRSMNPQTKPEDSELQQLFAQACELPPDQRQDFLEARCVGRPSLRSELERLLAADVAAGGFMAGAAPPSATEGATVSQGSAGASLGLVGRYKLLQVVGEGGFGVVYMAEQMEPVRRRVALKLIKAGMDTRSVIARFDAERQALAMMNHPNIASVFDAGELPNGRPYFVMELVNGLPLTQYCDENRLTARQRLELFIPVCQAVQHAHQKGIIHRDLKPSNVLVTLHDGVPVPKVIDFGIAKATQVQLTEKTLFTQHRQMIGTPQYMSPEQAEMTGLDIDTRTDVYSLGVMLYELLTGTTPLDTVELRRKAYDEIQRSIREVDPPLPSQRISTIARTDSTVAQMRSTAFRQLQNTIRGDLDWVVMKCLEKSRTRRYDTVAALAADLSRYLQNQVVSAAKPSASYRLKKYILRHRLQAAAIAVVTFSMLSGTGVSTWGFVREARQRRLAESRRVEADTARAAADQQRVIAEQQQQIARNQAAIAEAIGEFLGGVLSAADPEQNLGDKVTVLQALNASVAQMDQGALASQPEVEAAVRDTIGQTYESLGRYDLAEPQLKKALERRRAEKTPDEAKLVLSLNNLGGLLIYLAQYHEAVTLLREAVAIDRRLLKPNDAELAQVISDLATALMDDGDLTGADSLFAEAVAIDRRGLPASAQQLGNALHNQATLRQQQHRYIEAEQLAREGMAIDQKLFPPEHPQLAADTNNLGEILALQGKPQDAEAQYRIALEILRKVCPPLHPNIATTLSNLADVLEDQGKFDAAEATAQQALEMDRALLPAGHPNIAIALNNLANARIGQRRFKQAEQPLREAVDIVKNVDPAVDRHVNLYWNNLAKVLYEEGSNGEAEGLLRKSIATFATADDRQLPQARQAVDMLVQLLDNTGRAHEADELRKTLGLASATTPATKP